jgi:intracellular multiplication protein IcmT
LDTKWRNTYKPARFLFMDARAGIPLLPLALHFRWYTVAFAVVFIVFFWILERRGLTFGAAFRAIRAWLVGDIRPALGRHKQRGMIDHGRRDF